MFAQQDIKTHAPGATATDWGFQCDHSKRWTAGLNRRNGRQKFMCARCRRVWTDGAEPRDAKRERIARALLLPGSTSRTVAHDLGVSDQTVRTVLRIIGHRRPPCPCGRTGGHNGFCKWRFERSPAAQAVLTHMREVLARKREIQNAA